MNISPYIHKVQFYETDQMGIVHHSNYIRWFEGARVDYMEQLGFGYERAMEAGIDIGVLSIACDYKSMVRFGQSVKIYLTITALTAMKLAISYKIVDSNSGELRATGESQHFYYNNKKQRPISLKKELPTLYDIFAKMMCNQLNKSN